MAPPLKIAAVAAFPGGGAGIAARRCHEGLRAQGVRSEFLLKSAPLEQAGAVIDISRRYAQLGGSRHLINLFEEQRDANRVASAPYPTFGWDFLARLRRYDLVHLHWIGGVLSPEALAFLAEAGTGMVWTLHDENP